jgi:microcystin-dependent protein
MNGNASHTERADISKYGWTHPVAVNPRRTCSTSGISGEKAMSNPYLGQIVLVGFNFAPVGYIEAAGQVMPISTNTALFSLFGTYYGGNGTSNFGIPNLQGNCVVGQGQGPGLSPYDIGQTGGSSTCTLSTLQVPAHNHLVNADSIRADQTTPTGNFFALSEAGNIYNNSPGQTTVGMSPSVIPGTFGNNQPHNNMMPYQVLNWIVAVQGVFPPRS